MTAENRNPTILVTRPERGGRETATALRAMGAEPVLFPLTEIVGLSASHFPFLEIDAAQIVFATSANAITYVPDRVLSRITDMPLALVGAATETEARKRGLANVLTVQPDVDHLVLWMANEPKLAQRALYICGHVRRDTLEVELARRQIACTVLETYNTKKVSQLTDKWQDAFVSHAVDAIMVYSSVSATILAELLTRLALPEAADKTPVFAISDRAASTLQPCSGIHVLVAEAPDADAMLDAVRRHFFAPRA
ncbi:MAG: uroporphyrinogen-III synthase [Pseudomonadota bacterium]